MKTIIAMLLFCWSTQGMTSTVLIKPADNKILFEGRYADIDEGRAFDWGHTRISFNTNAREIILLLDDGRADYNLEIDGKPMPTLVTRPKREQYPYVLGKGDHHVVLTRRNDPNYGEAIFKGVELVGGQLLEAPAAFSRKLEWIGASWMTGYGVEGPGVQCSGLRRYENAARAFPSLVSARLMAQMHLTAISGKGVVRNWGYQGKAAPDPLPFYYERGSSARETPKWDHARFRADAVLISLGGNDYSTEPVPDDKDWFAGFDRLLLAVRKAHGIDVPVFLIYNAPYPPVARLTEAFAKRHNLGAIKLDMPSENELGCDWHPKAGPNQRWAARIEKELKAKLNW